MLINFKKLGSALAEAGLTDKPVSAYSKEEVGTLAQVVISSLVPPKKGPFLAPYINNLELIIPAEADPKYWWWSPAGQSIAVTLRELKVSEEVWNHYLSTDFTVPF